MDIGIIGLEAAGKTTFFSLLTGSGAEVGPGRRGESNVGVGRVPDSRIDRLSEMYKPKKTTYASIRFTDIPGLEVSRAGQKKRTSEFLRAVQGVDCLVHVVRAFTDDAVPHPEGSIDPMRDLEMVQSELVLTDWGLVETRLDRMAKSRIKNPGAAKEEPVLSKCMEALEAGLPLSMVDFTEEEEKLISGYTLFTRKPVLVVVNADERQLQTGDYPQSEQVADWCRQKSIPLLVISARVELEISELEEEDRRLFMADYGLKETGIARLAQAAYHHLGLISFFTVGEDEVRAWTVRSGATAKEAGGRIHSDIARGFIRAEVAAYADLIEHGAMAALREKGLLRLEGKDYLVQDGDIMSFRFNV